jgi:thioredoxin 1
MEELRTLPEYLKASNADGTVILQATATWCSQCKAIAPFVEKLVKQFPEAKFYKYDTDSAGDIAQELGVSQMPVFTIFQDGDLEDTVTGAKGKALEEAVRKVYKGDVIGGEE